MEYFEKVERNVWNFCFKESACGAQHTPVGYFVTYLLYVRKSAESAASQNVLHIWLNLIERNMEILARCARLPVAGGSKAALKQTVSVGKQRPERAEKTL